MWSSCVQGIRAIDKRAYLHQSDEPEIEKESGLALLVNDQREQWTEHKIDANKNEQWSHRS